jgi:hypothetical protein
MSRIVISKIRMVKSRGVRWAENVAQIRRRGIHINCWWESQKERGY